MNKAGTVQIIGNPKPGDETGLCTEFYPNGNLKSKKYYKNGLIQGKYVEYHKNGKILAYGQYTNSKKIGEWIWYGEDGRVQVEKSYED